MEIGNERLNDLNVLTLSGRLDAGSAERFISCIKELLEGHQTRFILDMKSLDFLDSTGVGMLLSAHRLVTGRGGAIKICNIQRQVKSLLLLTRLGEIFELFDDRESAIETARSYSEK